MALFTIALILIAAFLPANWPPFFLDIWHAQIFALFIGTTITISISVYKRIHPSVIPPFVLASFSAYSLYFWPEIVMPGFGLATVAAFGSLVVGSYVFMLMILLPFLLHKRKEYTDLLLRGLAIAGIVDSLVMIFNLVYHLPYKSIWVRGLLENNSMDACFLACLVPCFLDKESKRTNLMLIPLIAAILLSSSVTGIMALAIGTAVFYGLSAKIYRKPAIICGLLAGLSCVALVLYHFLGWKIEHGDGRYWLWGLAKTFWLGEANRWFGTGLGSFQMYGPGLVLQTVPPGTKIDLWIWLHNDWLQILFELGYLGLASVIVMFFSALWRGRKSPGLFSSLIVYGFIALGQMPARHTLFALLGACLLSIAFEKNHSTS